METINYYELSETELLTAWHKHWDYHENAYLANNTQGCVDASIEMDKIADALIEKFQYSGSDIEKMYFN